MTIRCFVTVLTLDIGGVRPLRWSAKTGGRSEVRSIYVYINRKERGNGAHMRRVIAFSTLKPRGKVAAVAALCAVAFCLMVAAAFAFSEPYANYVENGGYAQSAAAHTFVVNDGAGGKSGTIACQLFNHESGGPNEVTHGDESCVVGYGGGKYVWARVYNEIGEDETVAGEAFT